MSIKYLQETHKPTSHGFRHRLDNFPSPPSLEQLVQKIITDSDPYILRLPEVCARTGRATSTIWKDISDGIFFPPIATGLRSSGWIKAEVCIWIEACVINSRGGSQIDLRQLVASVVFASDQTGKEMQKGRLHARKIFESTCMAEKS